MRDGAVYNNLDLLIRALTRVNNQIYELVIELRYNSGVSGLNYTRFYLGGSHGKRRALYNPYRLILIELDFTQRKKTLGGKKQYRGKKVMNYYSYSKPGYITKDYRLKNMVKRPQLNILERVLVRKTKPLKD